MLAWLGTGIPAATAAVQDPAASAPAVAPAAQGTAPAPAPAVKPDTKDDPDRDIRKVEPDFSVIALPTTLRVPGGAGAFRLTHRFTRALNQGSLGELPSDLFGLDNGAVIGFEYRYGIASGFQAGINRTSDATIELFTQYDLMQQNRSKPIGLDVVVAVEGLDNLSAYYSPSIGAVLSRSLGDRAALYAQPLFVGNTNLSTPTGGSDHTFMLGLGTRVRLGDSTYLVAETVPRLAGYTRDSAYVSFGLEKRAGGHMFQLNVSNGFGTTFGQVARGVQSHDGMSWHLGFNLSRKFY